ncbi:MAG: hypothetical protein ABL997_09705 [Planctomycetota bacterium]
MLLASALAAGFAALLPAQGPCFDTNFGPSLALADDQVTTPLPLGFSFTYNGVAYTDISVCANGYIILGSTNVSTVAGGDYSPTLAEMATGGVRICPYWNDFNPTIAGSGQVYYDNSTPGVARVSWIRVYTYGTTLPGTMQISFFANNTYTVAYGTLGTTSTFQANTALIGASPGVTTPTVSFATRPLNIATNAFAEVITRAPGQFLPYGNSKWLFTPTNPGYVVTDVTCTPNVATSVSVGAGCPAAASPTLYEQFSAGNAPDLSGRDLSLLPSGPDYIALPGLSPTWFAGAGTALTAGDDTSHLVALPFAFPFNNATESSIYVSSNGFLTIGGTDPGSGCCTGDPAVLVGGPARIAAWWEDLDPTAGGTVEYATDPLSGEFVVSWRNVPEYGALTPNSCQIALSPTGQITIRWQSVSLSTGFFLAGYSRGGNVQNTGPVDLSAVNGLTVQGTEVFPLTLTVPSGSVPSIGSNYTLDANNIAGLPNGIFCILLISTEIPGGIPLDGLGLTGCTAYVALPELLSFFNLTLGAPTTTFLIAIPNNPAFVSVQLMSQAVSDDLTANAFGYRASNGVRWTIGI